MYTVSTTSCKRALCRQRVINKSLGFFTELTLRLQRFTCLSLLTALTALLLGTGCGNGGSSHMTSSSPPPPVSLSLQPVVSSGLSGPLGLEQANDGSGRLFAVEQGGRIRIIQNGVVLAPPFLDISGRIST